MITIPILVAVILKPTSNVFEYLHGFLILQAWKRIVNKACLGLLGVDSEIQQVLVMGRNMGNTRKTIRQNDKMLHRWKSNSDFSDDHPITQSVLAR